MRTGSGIWDYVGAREKKCLFVVCTNTEQDMAHLQMKICIQWMSNWRFNSPDKGMGCVEFVQMILKRHTPENSLYSQQLLSSCRCACVVMNIIEFNEFYLL